MSKHSTTGFRDANLLNLFKGSMITLLSSISISCFSQSTTSQLQFTPFSVAQQDGSFKKVDINKQPESFNTYDYLTGKTQEPQHTTASCNNFDFETGTFAGWTCITGDPQGTPTNATWGSGPGGYGYANPWGWNKGAPQVKYGIDPKQHRIVSGGTDPCGNFPMVRPGGSFSALLGDDYKYKATLPNPLGNNEQSTIYNKFVVTPANQYIIVYYAAVMQNGHAVSPTLQAFFETKVVLASDSETVVPCSYFRWSPSTTNGGANPTPKASVCAPDFKTTVYLGWNSRIVDLSAYVGTTVMLVFTASDCGESGHSLYAYVDAECFPNYPEETINVCTGPVTLNAPVTATSTGTNPVYSWSNGQVNPTINVSTSGDYTVSSTSNAVNDKGCKQTKVYHVTIGSGTTAFTMSSPGCNNPNVSFTDASTGGVNQWSWNFGDGNSSTQQSPTHTFAGAGPYTVTLTSSVGGTCSGTTTKTVVIAQPPTASFNFTPTSCGNSIVNFTDASTGTPISWSWDFGDGSTSTQQSPSHNFTGAGPYTVTLTSSTGGTCTNSITRSVTIAGGSVTAAFNNNPPSCGNSIINFTDASTGGPGQWKWTFGDGASSTQQSPSHTYTTPGTYTVTLVSSINGSCKDSIKKSITIVGGPTSDFNMSPATCGSFKVDFTDASTGSPDQWSWNFGDASSSTQQSPSHTYSGAGVYTVTLTSTLGGTCSSTSTKTVSLTANPVSDFTYTPAGCGSMQVNFTDASSGTPNQWSWSFGDGSNSTQQSPSHTYAAMGTYTVTLTSSVGGTCSASITKSFTISGSVKADFTAPPTCFGNATNFTNISTGLPNQWSWDFGDGSNSTLQTPSHTYAAQGQYTVSLTVSLGTCTDTKNVQVTVFPPETANFTKQDVCLGNVTSFTNTSSTLAGSTWSWDFGDGTTPATQQDPTHTYTTAGTFNTILTMTAPSGCVATKAITLTVLPMPVAAFSASPVCLGKPTLFSDLTSGANPQTWAWTFGDGGTSTLQSPSYTYVNATSYTVTLVVDAAGCTSSLSKKVDIVSPPVANLTAPDTMGCAPLCIDFSDLSVASAGSDIVAWKWSFSDGGSSTSQNPKHCFNKAGDWDVSLTVTNDVGCSDTYTHNKMIHTYPTPLADFSFTPSVVTEYEPLVQFIDQSSSDANVWYWQFGDGDSISNLVKNPKHIYNTESQGTYTVTLTVYNQYQCKDVVQYPLDVKLDWSIYVPNAFTPNRDGKNEIFYARGVGITEFEMWIYDRWGNEIYYSKDMYQGWDGKVQGGGSNEIAQQDVYVWLIQVTDNQSKKHKLIGHVSLIK